MDRKTTVKLTNIQSLNHYSIVFFSLFLSIIFLLQDLLLFGLTEFSLSIVFYLFLRKCLNFTEIKIRYTEKEFNQALVKTVSDLKWEIIEESNEKLLLIRPNYFTGSRSETITIIKYPEAILINSICTPHFNSTINSWGKNKKNLNTFIHNLKSTVNKNN